jgi:hypothetical protein
MKRVLVAMLVIVATTSWATAERRPSSQQVQAISARLPTPTPKPTLQMVGRPLLTSVVLLSQGEAADQQKDEVTDRNGWGPILPGYDLSTVEVEQIDRFYDVDLRDLCRYSLEVYPDANPDSGIFYYRPQAFAIKFDPPDYYLSIEYKAGDAGGENVLMQAQLTPGADQTDRRILEALLRAYLKQRGQRVDDPYLLPLPVTYEADFQLQHWNIEEVTVNGVDPDTGEIRITLSADVPTKELVTSTLGNTNGLTGHVDLRPIMIDPDRQNFTEPIRLVAGIRLPDALGGPPPRWRPPYSGARVDFKNEWPFEMRLDYLAYLIEDSGRLKLRGWSLGETTLGPNDTARLTTLQLNSELLSDNVVTALYLGDLQRDDEVVRRVVESCTSGVGQLPVTRLMIDPVDADALFDQYNIHKLVVEVRSAHFDPDGREVVSHSYDIDAGDDTVMTDPLHLWQDQGDLYHYRVVVITRDGAIHGNPNWFPPNEFLPEKIPVGPQQVEEALAQ